MLVIKLRRAIMDVMGGLLSSRRRWQEGQDKLKYQFVHSSRHGLDLVQRIAEGMCISNT